MLRAAIIFFVLAIIAMVFGAYGVAGLSVGIGRILLFVFLAGHFKFYWKYNEQKQTCPLNLYT